MLHGNPENLIVYILGNYLLHTKKRSEQETRKFIVDSALGILKSVLRSKTTLKLGGDFEMKGKTIYLA